MSYESFKIKSTHFFADLCLILTDFHELWYEIFIKCGKLTWQSEWKKNSHFQVTAVLNTFIIVCLVFIQNIRSSVVLKFMISFTTFIVYIL